MKQGGFALYDIHVYIIKKSYKATITSEKIHGVP